MALGFTNLGASATPDTQTGTDNTTFSTASWSPPTSGIILLAIFSANAAGDDEVASVSGNGLTWVKIADCGYGGDVPARRVTLYAAWAAGATTGATTVAFAASQLGFIAEFCQVTGSFTVSDVRDAFPQITQAYGNGLSGAVTVRNPVSSAASRPFAVFAHGANEGKTPRTNWTELDDLGGTGPVRNMETQCRTDAWEGTASATWATSTQWGAILVEINESGLVVPTGGGGVVGGVFSETPGFMGPIQDGNGNLYTITEVYPNDAGATSSPAQPAILKSEDDGDTWFEVDGGNRPHYNDLESIWLVQDGTTVHVLWQRSLDQVFYSSFNTSDAVSNSDRWAVVDEIANPEPASAAAEESCCLVQLSDGTLIAFYNTNNGTVDCIGYRTRTGVGSWSGESTIVATGKALTQVIAVRDASDIVHIFITDHTTPAVLYYTLTAGVLAGPTTVASGANVSSASGDTAAVLSVPQLTASGVYVAWINNSGTLVGCEIVGGTPGTIETISDVAVDSNPGATTSAKPSASLSRNGSDLHVIYADESATDLSRDVRSGGAWGTDVSVQSAITAYYAESAIFTRGSDTVLGYFWGDGTALQGAQNDPTPMYGEVVVGSAAVQAGILGRHRQLSWLS